MVDQVMFHELILPCLRYITFQGNPLGKIEKHFFYSLRESNLRELNFQNCELEHIDSRKMISSLSVTLLDTISDAFQYLSRIQHIDFYNNPKLLVLSGAHSPLSAALFYLPSKHFTSLGLANNELFTIPMILNYVVANTVERINLSGNFLVNLGTFNINMFPGMGKHLRYLILKRSNIRSIEEKAFQSLKKLEYLNLSENQLRSVPEALKLSHIKHLDLSYQCTMVQKGGSRGH